MLSFQLTLRRLQASVWDTILLDIKIVLHTFLCHVTLHYATICYVSASPFGSNLLVSTGLLLSANIDLRFPVTVTDHICHLNSFFFLLLLLLLARQPPVGQGLLKTEKWVNRLWFTFSKRFPNYMCFNFFLNVILICYHYSHNVNFARVVKDNRINSLKYFAETTSRYKSTKNLITHIPP
jgi:hypothetical protein